MSILKPTILTMNRIFDQLEFITLNLASFGWIILDVLHATPNWLTILVGLSIVFFNIARGIAVLKNKDHAKKD